MEDASDSSRVALPLDNDDQLSGRTRSESASSGHKRSSSGSLLSKLSFLRMIQATHNNPERAHSGIDRDDSDGFGSSVRGGRAMASALQQRRTRRRRGSLRKTALLGTRFEYRDKKASRAPIDMPRADVIGQQQQLATGSRMQQPLPDTVSPDQIVPHGNAEQDSRPEDMVWEGFMNTQPKSLDQSAQHHRQNRSQNSILGGEITTDDEDIVFFPPSKNTNAAVAAAAGLHLQSASSSSDSYYALSADSTYRAMHRTKSPLATHAVDITSSQDMNWDYSETEWWGWIILIVTWLVFVVGMGSCFGVWSWAWDVGETPYAPPELEDDPTLPIIGYYPALIILTAVMSWVWVVVAWVGMKYFKHANISGDDT
ncbi:hypothetical protein BDV37DRAFT_42874 [Aspergillus pseudonomiae]|uniref:Uncharacterized protein n=1 Tax=Aspergillus pseudonomiae TaxID=1506151 RepID=A0A5N7CUY4_9EURO|nr:uncharacterized protein BDV37DRAFT_42874 [Aspergillus pseudonomiae]KAE8397941.1 hypothetical protein BDV37DRAFT_42874 [Aspergillus pseudonomiae]